MNDHRWLCMSLFSSCYYYSFMQRHQRKTDYDLMESAGLKQRNKSEISSSTERDLFIPAKGSLPRDYLSRDSEYKGPGWSHSWTRDKADCSHREWEALLIPKGSFHGLSGHNGFCIPVTSTHAQLFWFRSKAKTIWESDLMILVGAFQLRIFCGLWSGALSPSAAPHTCRSERAGQAFRTLPSSTASLTTVRLEISWAHCGFSV